MEITEKIRDGLDYLNTIPTAHEIYKISEAKNKFKEEKSLEVAKLIISDFILPKIQESSSAGFVKYTFYSYEIRNNKTENSAISSLNITRTINENSLNFEEIYKIIKEILEFRDFQIGDLRYSSYDRYFEINWDVEKNKIVQI